MNTQRPAPKTRGFFMPAKRFAPFLNASGVFGRFAGWRSGAPSPICETHFASHTMNPKLKKALMAIGLILTGVVFSALIRAKIPGASKLPSVGA